MPDIAFYFFLIICGGVAGWCWALIYADIKAARERNATPTITIPKGTTKITVTTYGGGGGGGVCAPRDFSGSGNDTTTSKMTIDLETKKEDENGGA